MKMVKLFYLDMTYPFDYQGETFLATEMKYQRDSRLEKYIFPIWANRQTQPAYKLRDTKVIDSVSQYTCARKIGYCIRTLGDTELYKEIRMLKRTHRFNMHNFIKAVCFFAQGNYLAEGLIKYIRNQENKEEKIILYSYWLHLDAYIAAKIKQKLGKQYSVYALSRCHRFDVYEYAQDGYIPCRSFILDNLDEIIPISEDARKYLYSNYEFNKEKLIVKRLGTVDPGIRISEKQGSLKILSCSWMRKVKRNSLIFEAIKELDFPIEWTHIGIGEEYDVIKQEIENLGRDNIKCRLLGKMPNDEVIRYYQNNDFNVFINVSRSEGVPVSIMEAMALGKVVIATDVGGSKEIIVQGKNGFLLNIDFKIEELRNILKKINDMGQNDYLEMCKCSRRIWESMCDAEVNYKEFNSYILRQYS